MSDVKLRECPFCGSDNLRASDHGIECRNCGVWFGDNSNLPTGKGIDGWNRRAPSAVEQELREAVALLEFYEGSNEKPPEHKPNMRPWVEINYEDFMTALTKLRAALLAKGDV